MAEEFSGALSYLREKRDDISPAEATKKLPLNSKDGEYAPSFGSLFSYFLAPTVGCALGPSSAGPGLPNEGEASPTKEESDRQSAPTDEPDGGSMPVSTTQDKVQEETVEELELFDIEDFDGNEASKEGPVVEEERVPMSLLIEARITLDDGGVVPCRVSAADRCKEVARRFVEEHSLKSVFEAPLTAFLMKIEKEAVSFPVEVEANLMDIRQEYSK